MTVNKHHPYTLDIMQARKPGQWEWTIRRSGKLMQRSDKTLRSEADALKDGEKVVEGLLGPPKDQR